MKYIFLKTCLLISVSAWAFAQEMVPLCPIITTEFSTMPPEILQLQGLESKICPFTQEEFAELVEIENVKVSNLQQYQKKRKEKFHLFKLIYPLLPNKAGGTKELIKKYYQCGGKKGSEAFITSMILEELDKACILATSDNPNNPLAFKDALEMATTIARGYENRSLLNLNKNVEKIEQEVLHKAIDKVLDSYLKPYIDDENKRQEVLSKNRDLKYMHQKIDLAFSKKHGKTDVDDMYDYLDYVFSKDAAYSLADELVWASLEKELNPYLPAGTNKEEFKKGYLKNLNTCLAPYQDASLALMKEQDASSEHSHKRDHYKIQTRKKLEKKLCKEESKKEKKEKKESLSPNCSAQSCRDQINFSLAQKSDISEQDLVQGCAFGALLQSLEGLVTQSIENNKESLAKYLSSEQMNELNDQSWREMKKCINTGHEQALIDDSNNLNTLALAHLSTEAVSSQIKSCMDPVTSKAGEFVIDKYLRSDPSIKAAFESSHILGEKVGQDEFNQDILTKAYWPCIKAQEQLVQKGIYSSVDPAGCEAAIEMEVAKNLVDDQLSSLFKEPYPPQFKQAQRLLSQCQDQAKNNFYQKLDTPVENYLDQNPEFYNCVKNSIESVVPSYTEKSYLETVEKTDALTDKKFARAQKEKFMKISQHCFKTKVGALEYWSDFKTSLSDGRFDKIQKNCTDLVTGSATGNLVLHETEISLDKELASLEETGLLTADESKELKNIILSSGTNVLMQSYNIQDQDILASNRPASIVGNSYLKHQAQGKKDDDFFNDYQTIMTTTAYDEIRNFFLLKLDTYIRKNYPQLKAYDIPFKLNMVIDAACIQNLQHAFSDAESTNSSTTSLNIDSILEMLASGFNYLHQKSPNDINSLVSQIDQICKKHPVTQHDIMNLSDFIIKGQIQNSIKDSLNSFVGDLKKKTTVPLDVESLIETLNDFPSFYKKADNQEAAKRNYASNFAVNPTVQQQVEQIRKQQISDLEALIRNKIENSKELDKLIFSDGTITNFAKENLSELTNPKGAKYQELQQAVITRLFQEDKDFASKFTEINLAASIAEAGMFKVYLSVTEKTDTIFLSEKTANRAVRTAVKNWDYNLIKEKMDWQNVDEKKRKEMISSLRNNVIVPQMNGEKGNLSAVEELVTNFADSYRYSDNQTLTERLSEAVEKEVKEVI